jgi:ABC-type transport system involved in multi-copper enzyme maturation permease subunit
MNLAFAIRTVRWMIRDTFRQSIATKLFWVMLAITFVCTLFCFSVDIVGGERPQNDVPDAGGMLSREAAKTIGDDKVKKDGVLVVGSDVSIGFGMMKFSSPRPKDDSVRHVQLWLAAILADTAGVLLALLWTAGFLPTFLEPQSATVLLAKPASRTAILCGKYFGVVLFVALQALVFVACTWLALGMKTGVWNAIYWFAVPLLTLNFAVFYAVSTFLAVVSRSTVVCIFGTLLFWLLCWTVNFTHVRLTAQPLEAMSGLSMGLLDLMYWVLPKPLDLGGVFYDAMMASGFSSPVPELHAIKEKGQFHPEASIVTSIVFGLATLALAAYEFWTTDY